MALYIPISAFAQQGDITSHFNAAKPILPSSQYTPDAPYKATVWVFNDGRRYTDRYYNQILGIPDADADGREWFEPEYQLTDSDIAWQEATAPFSSDEYYNNDEYKLLTEDQKALLKTDGTENVIAVHVHQNWGGAFADCGLYEADMRITNTLLNTVEDGPWECKYYMLNYNSDIAQAEECEWYSPSEDESDWITGVGPFSNDANMFYTTEWPSQVRPILIRRHFTLTADDMADIKKGAEVSLTCSYDENPVMYLNGTKIWSATGWNDNNYAEIILNSSQKEKLHEGDNVLAVSLTQGNGGGHVDYGLKITSPYEMNSISFPDADKENHSHTHSRIFNLHGQYLGTCADTLPRGIYIRGGKKLVLGK